tara:strand:+ start:498 stop:677 length:180 start_codon:yes stop_codon:yes gene_type:complete
LVKPNKDEIVVITIMISMVIGFFLGVLSTKAELLDANKDIEELLEVVETQQELIERFLE